MARTRLRMGQASVHPAATWPCLADLMQCDQPRGSRGKAGGSGKLPLSEATRRKRIVGRVDSTPQSEGISSGSSRLRTERICGKLANPELGHRNPAGRYSPRTRGFWPVAPSGAYAAGVTFIARDVVQRTTGRLWSLIVIVPGVILTAVMSPRLAVASAAAFMLSELIDFGVFTPLQNRGLVLAVFVSGIVASAVDSLTFLELAGIPLEAALLGLLLAKFWVQLIATPLTQLLRRSLPAVATAR